MFSLYDSIAQVDSLKNCFSLGCCHDSAQDFSFRHWVGVNSSLGFLPAYQMKGVVIKNENVILFKSYPDSKYQPLFNFDMKVGESFDIEIISKVPEFVNPKDSIIWNNKVSIKLFRKYYCEVVGDTLYKFVVYPFPIYGKDDVLSFEVSKNKGVFAIASGYLHDDDFFVIGYRGSVCSALSMGTK